MGNRRRSYSREFKIEAVALVTEGGLSISQAARDPWHQPDRAGPLEEAARSRP